ncbi:MAG: hypothetical protein Q7T61_19020 [Caulobacter sp.]|nr:hypothetical protein [Caulobacter sp.]
MARYHFHIDSDRDHTDRDGHEVASLEDAKTLAAASIADLLRDGPSVFWGTEPWVMRVTDAEGTSMFCIEVHGYLAPAAKPYDRLS